MPNLIVGLGVTMPAFAESFPSNGYMLENKTYSDAATYNNMGAYDGTVTATAEYANTLYKIIGGTYLPAGAEVAAQCPANSYCPGVTDATYNASASQGATSCPSGYPNSAMGASAITQCYTACTLRSANIEHATAVSGNDYNGDGTDTCFATACENGYHENNRLQVIEDRPLIDVDVTIPADSFDWVNANGGVVSEGGTYNLTAKNSWAAGFSYGTVYGLASCNDEAGITKIVEEFVMSLLMGFTVTVDELRSMLEPSADAILTDSIIAAYEVYLASTKTEADLMILYNHLMPLAGIANDANYSTTDSGQHCYCRATSYAPGGADEISAVGDVPWVYNGSYDDDEQCALHCAHHCASSLENSNDSTARKTRFGAIRVTYVSTCDANEIKINWTDATEEDIAANNAGMCTYGGDIRTPVRAATIPGKTFVGWKFSK